MGNVFHVMVNGAKVKNNAYLTMDSTNEMLLLDKIRKAFDFLTNGSEKLLRL